MYLPLISFVIPFYNRFALLKEALQSVLDSPFKDVEIVLIDDASDADGLEEILAFIKPFENIIYLRQGENLGPGAARNRGLTAAKGEWIFFMDSDDVIYGDILSDLAVFLSKEGDCDTVIFNNYLSIFSDGRTQIKQFGDGTVDGIINDLETGTCTLWNFCFKRAFLNNAGISCSEAYTFEDWTAVISAWCHSKKHLSFSGCFYGHRNTSEISLAVQERDFDFASKTIPSGLNAFFNRLIQLSMMDIPQPKKNCIDRLIYRYILNSRWSPELYKNNETVKNLLNRLRVKIADYSGNFTKKIFISPCFIGALNAAVLIKEWGGYVAGFIDNNPCSPRALSLKKASALDVNRIDGIDLRGGGGGGSYLYLAGTLTLSQGSTMKWGCLKAGII